MFFNIKINRVLSEEVENKVSIYLTDKKICSGRLNKCFKIAIGSSKYPTPLWKGPRYLTIHYKQGFTWINPLTNQLYKPNTHNLGSIWIQLIKNNKGWDIGIHQTPELNKPIEEQVSHGCIRMMPQDIKELSNNLKYFDEFYIIP